MLWVTNDEQGLGLYQGTVSPEYDGRRFHNVDLDNGGYCEYLGEPGAGDMNCVDIAMGQCVEVCLHAVATTEKGTV